MHTADLLQVCGSMPMSISMSEEPIHMDLQIHSISSEKLFVKKNESFMNLYSTNVCFVGFVL